MSSVDIKVKGRTIGARKQKYQEGITMDVKRSAQAMSALVDEVSKANELYGKYSNNMESMVERMEDVKFLQALPPGSREYKSVLEENMKKRKERKKSRAENSGEWDVLSKY